MSMFSDFARLQDQVNRLMGDFSQGYGSGYGGRRQRQHLGGWNDPLDAFMPIGFNDDFFDTPLLLSSDLGALQQGQGQQKQLGSGVGQQQGQLQKSGSGKGDEKKMSNDDEKALSTQLTHTQPGGLMQTFQPGRLMRARVNVEDAKDKYVVTAEMPSFDKQNISVNVTDDGMLTIKGEQKQEFIDEAKDKKYLRAERTFANVERTLRIPKGVDTSKIQANYENGVLHVHLPKLPEAEKKQQQITIA